MNTILAGSNSRNSPRLQMDWEQLHHLSDNNPEFEVELLQLYVADSAEHLPLLKKAIALQDTDRGERLAHHLKGASANVGIRALQSLAARLEMSFEHRQFQMAEGMVSEFESLLGDVAALV